MSKCALLLTLVLSGSGLASAANDPMVGDWKLNQQKSQLIDEMKVAALEANKYSFDFGGPGPESIVVDGTDQPGNRGTTLAVAAGTAGEWTVVRKKDGQVELKAIWTITSNGAELHDNYTEFGGDGKQTFHFDYIYARMGGGPGFAGDWVATFPPVEAYAIQLRPYQDDGLSLINLTQKTTRNLVFDGKDYPASGFGGKAEGSARRVDAGTIELTDKMDGRVLATQEMSISPDGKTMTITRRRPGRSQPDVLVFEKQ